MKPTHEQWLEVLVARCLDAGDTGYRSELERICAEHPAVAEDLRGRILHLEALGFVGARSNASPTQWLPDRIGGYRLTGLLGRGGMGVVFRGENDAGAQVAIKIVRPDLLSDDRARVRFRREALLASRLSHPGICPLLEIGIDDDVPFLVMPLLEGQTLRAWAAKHSGERDRLLQLVESWARALHAAHEAGLVHRDVTPGNLFVTADGRAIVLDFGLARDTTGEIATLTMSHEQLGTLPYMAPEQLGAAARIDRRADVYALGVVLYEGLAGRKPFESENRSQLSRMIASGESPRLRRLVRDVPRALDRIVHKAIDVDPALRYSTAEGFADDLDCFRAGRAVVARGPGVRVRTVRWVTHHPVAAITISLLTLLVVVSGFLVASQQDALRVQTAAESALRSRSLEHADPMNSIADAIAAYEADPGPKTIGQLDRVLHFVSLLASVPVERSQVRDLAVCRLDADHDRVAMVTDGALSVLTLDRHDGSMREVFRLPTPNGISLRTLRFSPNGRFLAWGGNRWYARRLSIGDRREQELSFPGHEPRGEAWSADIDDDGNVWVADTGGKVWRFDASEGDVVEGRPIFNCRKLERPAKEGLRGLRLAADGDLLVWSFGWAWRLDRDGEVRWQWPSTGEWEDPRPRMTAAMSYQACVDEGQDRVMLCQLGEVRVLRWSTGAEVWAAAAPSVVTEATMVTDGTVVTLHADGVLRWWRDGQAPIATYRDADDQIASVVPVPGSDWVLAAGRGGTRTRIDALGRAERVLLGGDLVRWGPPGPFAVSTDGSVLVASGGVGRIRTWDFDGSRAPAQVRLVESPPVAVAMHPDGRRLLVLTEDHRLWQWDQTTNLLEPRGVVPFDIRCRNEDPNGTRVAFGGFRNAGGRIALLTGDDDDLRIPVLFRDDAPEVGGQFAPVGVAWLPGDRLVVGCGDNKFLPSRIQVLDARGATVPFPQARLADREVPITTGQITCLDASADGRHVAFGCVQGGIHVWQFDGVDQFSPLHSLDTGGERVWSIDLAADATFLVASLEDGSVLQWRLDQVRPVFLSPPRDRPARCLLADHDRLLIEFASDGMVHVWSTASGDLVLEVPIGDRCVVRDAIVLGTRQSPGDLRALRLATIASDGWLRLWSFDGDALLEQASVRRAVLGR